MKMKDYTRCIPEGLRDVQDEEALIKQKIEHKVRQLFTQYNYCFLETPTFEYLDVFTLGNQSYQSKDLYTWINREGEIVALRSDQTRAIARVVATSYSTLAYPKRYAYLSSTFRCLKQYQGKMHEFTQAGVELMGVTNTQSDAEIIVLAIEALKLCGIKDFTIHLASATFLHEVLEALDLTKEMKEGIEQAIKIKDAVSVRKILQTWEGEEALAELLIDLLQSSGSLALLEALKVKIKHPTILKALDYLENLYTRLTYFGVADYILFDFSILSYASYYTGMMFQAYTEGVGTAIVEGGRYDTLLQNFGIDVPAVGMAMNINLILQKYRQEEKEIKREACFLVGWESPLVQKGIKLAEELRSQGYRVECALSNDYTRELNYAKKTGIDKFIFLENESIHRMDKEEMGWSL